jgi:hypothetical protein
MAQRRRFDIDNCGRFLVGKSERYRFSDAGCNLGVRFVGAPSLKRPRRERFPVGRVAVADMVRGAAFSPFAHAQAPLPRFAAVGLASRLTACAPGLRGGIVFWSGTGRENGTFRHEL